MVRVSVSQKNGIIQLAILLLLLFVFFYTRNTKAPMSSDLTLNVEAQCWLKNEKAIVLERQLANQQANKTFTYHVNSLNDYRAYTIEMEIEEIDRYLSHKKSGKSIYTEKEFLSVTQIPRKRFDSIKKRLRFSEVTYKPVKRSPNKPRKIDLNKITVNDLLRLGFRKEIAFRVINYRKHLGAYKNISQLNNVYEISSKELKKLKESTYLK